MSKFVKELENRARRTQAIDLAIKEFQMAKPSYALQAGVFEMFARVVAADSDETTAELLSNLRKAINA